MNVYADELSKILDILKGNPRGMSVTDIANLVSVNRNTVSRYLDMLRISGQVDMKAYGKAKVFFISQRAPVSAMINFSSDMVVVIDSDLRIVQVNDSLCSLLDINDENIVGKEIRNSPLVGLDHPLINERLKAALEGEETVDEIRIVKIDREFFYKTRIIPTVLNDSTPGVTIMLEDITEKREAEEALRESEQNFRALVEEINDAIWNIDEEGRFIYASPRTRDILGSDTGEIIGFPLMDYLESSCAAQFETAIKNAKDTKKSQLIECLFKNSEGKSIKTESSICPRFDELGYLTGYRIVSRDISERENAVTALFKWKSFLGSIVQNIPAMVLVKEVTHGTYIFFNKSAEDFFGISRDDSVGKMGCELFPDRITEYLISGDRDAIAAGSPVLLPEISIKSANNSERIIMFRKVPIFGRDRKLEYIMTIGEDISEQKTAEAEILSQRDQAQSYLDVAGVMIAVVGCDGKIKSLNKKGCEFLGYNEEDIVGSDWFSTVVPKERGFDLKKKFESAISGGCVPKSGEKGFVLTKQGEEIEVVWHNTYLKNQDGGIIAMVSSAAELN
ncbi:PAS domain S-box protein [Methanoplanus sp. FWC-SCC4]|uniref:PAS domain S-box protein n=1 Tax=Methanochimaera problematica TaxID=2609417 RepID=A0AA97FCX4_9EURY|nr:PAS domain S-box protein [Methanoplanus sp. FWC-SCC4]WOF17200.1 PAS domain S-box protein [Methanoplanus sp. FWC-SCC4]